MKVASLLFVTTFFFTPLLQAQQISNAGLEHWQISSTQEPDSFWTSNAAIPHNSVTRTTDAHSGQYAALLVSTIPSSTASAGLMIYGSGINQGNAVGWPFYTRPERFRFWYKYNPQGADSALALLTFSNSGMPVGFAILYITNTSSTYTEANIPIQYLNSSQPDSISILFSTSARHPITGSALYIDDVFLDYTTGISGPSHANPFSLYPNPVTSFLTLATAESSPFDLYIMDVVGRSIYQRQG